MLKIILNNPELCSEPELPSTSSNAPSSRRKSRTYHSLISHSTELALRPQTLNYVRELRVMLLHYLGFVPEEFCPCPNGDWGQHFLLSPSSLLEMLGKVKINAFNIVDCLLRHCGTGIYLEASRFDHSCQPNAFQIFTSISLKVKANTTVSSLDEVNKQLPAVNRCRKLKDCLYL